MLQSILSDSDLLLNILQVAVSILAIMGTYAAQRVAKKSDAQIIDSSVARIKGGIMDVVVAALADDGKITLAELRPLVTRQLVKEFGKSMSIVKPTSETIDTITQAALAKASSEFLKGADAFFVRGR